ncbi:FAD-dependent monooxygenase [Glaciibacter sp. 2TAF33]|uniref:FAD-dependent monooxygenase n=1 Tax=Glaciibacter sp. 2TAF33 TaxID=3233015 RepID=UPI003F92D57E
MQFYLNGDQHRDPDLRPRASDIAEGGAGSLPDEVDVLIVGAGPAGMLLAAQLSQFAAISTRVVERRASALEMGHADGLHPRTLEMFQSFGLVHSVLREGYQANEFTFWGQSPDDRPGIVREGRTPDMPHGTSEFPHVVLNQARVQDFLAERMKKSARRLEPDFGHEVIAVERDEADDRVTVRLRRHEPDRAVDLTVRARYVVGCDGARSIVRQSMGLALVGDSQNHAWGVVDALVDTDFPDIRMKSSIAAAAGQVLVIPREGGYLVRLYVDMGAVSPGDHDMRARVSAEDIIAVARSVFAPYRLEVRHIQWWSLYEVGQRYTSRFDDCPEEQRGAREPRIFIAGDACHTHSAKAGQGMNVSMADAFNLGWKLAAVLEGRSPASLLDTYTEERQPVGVELIEFDRFWARLASGFDDQGMPVTLAERQVHQAKRRRFMAGVATRYAASSIVGLGERQGELAQGYPVGERFHSAPVIRLADAKPMQLGHAHDADGRWRMYLFGDDGDPTDPGNALAKLCGWLADDRDSPVLRFTPDAADIDSLIDIRAVLQQSNHEVELAQLPTLLWPKKGRFALPDAEKVFARDPRPGQDIFELRGIDQGQGCVVIVRPDQFVAQVLPLGARAELTAFFEGFMIPPVSDEAVRV